MSNLLEQASLVMIPSGYKEDVVYSEIPLNGAGDLSFTRASNGTRINSAGLVEVCPWNFCDYSEDQTQWTSQNETTVTANSTTAPNGTTTADTVTPSTANDDHYRGIVLGQQVGALTAFIYVKPNGYNFFDWGIYNSSQYIVRATFDLVNLTYTFTNAGTATIESVGNGWLKCGISGTNASLTTMSLYYRSRPTGGTGAFTGNGTSGAFIWGAQLNIGSTAKPYFPTTDRLNVPRLTYQNGGGGCPSLLLEKQSTNLLQYSEDFTNAVYGAVDVTITANNTTSPDGTQNADKMTIGTATSEHVVYNSLYTTILGQYSTSVYLKKGNSDYALIGDNGASGSNYAYMVINLNNGAITQTGYSGSYTLNAYNVESVGNGWYRCSITYTVTSDEIRGLRVRFSNSATPTVGIYGTVTYTGNGTDFMYIWGAQLEASSYPTSYIPTTSSSATRVVDACYKTGISSLIGQTAGTIFLEMTPVGLVTTYTERLIKVYGGGQEIGLQRYADSRLVGYGYLGGASNEWTFDIANVFTSTTQSVKIAMAYASNDVVIYVNGVQKGTDSSASMFSLLSAFTFAEDITGDLLCSQNIKQAVIFKTRLTNAELASLTTI